MKGVTAVGMKLHRSADRWYFLFNGEQFDVLYNGPGWGYSIHFNRSGGLVADGYHTLRDLREDAERAVTVWQEAQSPEETP